MVHASHFLAPRRYETEESESNRQTASLAGLAVALLLIVAGYYLFAVLHHACKEQDCVLSGRSNCYAEAAGNTQPRNMATGALVIVYLADPAIWNQSAPSVRRQG